MPAARVATLSVWMAAVVVTMTAPAPVTAQIRERFGAGPAVEGVLPDAAFEVGLRHYPPSSGDFAPFYAWDAQMAVDLALYRRGSRAAGFSSAMQAVGTENFGSRVSVGGTGYLIGFDYRQAITPDLKVAAGIMHLSSHLTRDLDEKLAEQRAAGATVPDLVDGDEFNVLYVRLAHRRATWRFRPEVEVIVHPISIQLGGGRHGSVRPLHVRARATIWSRPTFAVATETIHEVGRHSFHHLAVVVERHGRTSASPRAQLLVGFTPGHRLHVSPDVGAVRGGVAVGVRLNAGP